MSFSTLFSIPRARELGVSTALLLEDHFRFLVGSMEYQYPLKAWAPSTVKYADK